MAKDIQRKRGDITITGPPTAKSMDAKAGGFPENKFIGHYQIYPGDAAANSMLFNIGS